VAAKRVLLLALSMFLVVSCRGDGGIVPAGPSSERLTLRPLGSVEGAPAGYLEYVPPGYGDRKRRPLLISLHGAGENGDGSEKALELLLGGGIPRLIESDRWPERRPFIVLMPQHDGGYVPGTLCPSPREIDAFLRFATAHYDVDRRRIYLTGASCGAIGIWDYLAVHANQRVAAAVPIAGDGNPAVAKVHCALGKVAIWAIHGAEDSVVSVAGSIRPIEFLRRCRRPRPVDVRLSVYPGVDHDAASPTYDLSAGHDIYAWLLRHRRG
jgi:predicted peptidase